MPTRPSDMQVRYLQNWRADRGLTQKELADKAGVAASTVRRAERGETINVVSVAKLAKALGISVMALREEDPSVRPHAAR
jgi:transcriptional regulator with XRE-family HTH domain